MNSNHAKSRKCHPELKAALAARGLSYRTLAPELGVTYQHLCLVLNGHRESARVLRAVRQRLAA